MIEPAIVVIAYNREKPLLRLLKSLEDAIYPSSNIILHISIDASPNANIKQIADEFVWSHGEKIVDLKDENLGLRKHVLQCGGLTKNYESIVVLEDDLIVAPGFYNFAQKANDFYSDEKKISGVSLFTYPVEENNFYPFQPIHDDSNVHFIQVASSWGQCWSKEQWSTFTAWLTENPQGKEAQLPDYIADWGVNSWKKLFINYLIDTDRYFVFPNTSYSSNFEEIGTNSTQTGFFQVPMKMGVSEPLLKNWNESNSIYDVYFELIPSALKRIAPFFNQFDFEVDLYGTKPFSRIECDHLLTIRKGKNPVRAFGSTMRPPIQNVIFETEGNDIVLIEKSNIIEREGSKRFLKLSESNEKLRQSSDAFETNQEHVSIVVPVVEAQQLQLTLDSFGIDRVHAVTVLISCNHDFYDKFDFSTQAIGCTIKWVLSESSDLNELLRAGFNECTTNYITWVQAGMEIDLKKMEQVSTIFSGMKQVNFLRGIDDEVTEKTYLTKNSAPWRMTPQLAYYHVKGYRETTTELMVWRKAILDEINHALNVDYSNLFVELLKATPLYVLVDKIGSRKGIPPIHTITKQEVRKSLRDPKYRRNWFFRAIMHPYFHVGFYGNFPFIRFLYKELGRFPMVIRYDFRNNNYFLDNY